MTANATAAQPGSREPSYRARMRNRTGGLASFGWRSVSVANETLRAIRVTAGPPAPPSAPGRRAPGIGGHRGYRCWTCGAIDYRPPHTRPDMEAAYRPR